MKKVIFPLMSTKEERSITVTSQLKGAKLLHRQIIALRKGEGIPGVEFEEQGDDLFTVNICLTGPGTFKRCLVYYFRLSNISVTLFSILYHF